MCNTSFSRSVVGGLVALLMLAMPAAAHPAAGAGPQATNRAGAAAADDLGPFVRRDGSQLVYKGKPFRFGGTNNYYLMYKSRAMVDNLLTTAVQNHFNVLRTWGWLDIGNQDGSNSVAGKADGVYFQYWNGSAPAYNDGPDGLQHLDYVIYQAGQLGIKLVIPFTNNWSDFGGMDQYVRWANGQYHDQFYTDPTIRAWYKDWIAHLLNHVNIYTGIPYKNDPTIMMWELANEPRCGGSGVYPQSGTCTTQTLLNWAADVSAFVKSIDHHHLVGVGDEGFYCIPGATDWTENCSQGVDTVAFARLPSIDVMSAHDYPDSWGKDAAWATTWITRHIQDARSVGKPFFLGEFGLQNKSVRNPVYKQWTDAVYTSGGTGALFWMLAGKQDDGSYYPDYDGFTIYCPGPVCTTLSNFALMMAGAPPSFPPVADNDSATTAFNTPITLTPLANDITYAGAALTPGSLDLDPATAGRQSTMTVAAGTFTAQSDGSVIFTPAAGFAGQAVAGYTVQDSQGRTSNVASMTVTVKPAATGTLMLFSFEDGTEGWGPGNWQTNAGSVAQTSAFHTDGSYGLQISSTSGAWFGLDFTAPVDLTGKTHLKFDLQTGSAGTSMSVALKIGAGYQWCQTGWSWINPNTSTTIDVDLTQDLGCSQVDLTQIHGLYVWFSTGTFNIDAVRAE